MSFLSVSSPCLADDAEPTKHPLDRIVAIVNDSVITNNELNVQVDLIRNSLEHRQMPIPPDEVLRKQVLQHMIDVELEEQVAKHAGVSVDSHDVDEAIDNIAKRNHLTVEQVRQKMEAEGVSWKEYRRNVKKEVMINRLQAKAVGQIIVTDQQVDDYLASNAGSMVSNKYRIEDILIPLPANPTSEQVQAAEKQAEAVMRQLKNGANFNQLAVAESQGESALQGGDLGYRSLPELPDAFSSEVIHMKPGELAGPIRIPNGWHVIKLIAVEGNASGVAPTKEQVKNFLYQRKYNEAVQNWMTQIRSTGYIQTFLQ